MLTQLDMSVLPKNRQLEISIRNYIRDTSKIFSISSLVKIPLKSFICFSFVFHLVLFLFSKHSYLCNKKIKPWFEHTQFILSWKKEFAPLCNILYVCRQVCVYFCMYVFFYVCLCLSVCLFVFSDFRPQTFRLFIYCNKNYIEIRCYPQIPQASRGWQRTLFKK